MLFFKDRPVGRHLPHSGNDLSPRSVEVLGRGTATLPQFPGAGRGLRPRTIEQNKIDIGIKQKELEAKLQELRENAAKLANGG